MFISPNLVSLYVNAVSNSYTDVVQTLTV